MSEINSNIINIFTSRNNLVKQLKKAGFNTDAYENFTIGEISSMERHNSLDFNVSNDSNSHIIIKYYLATFNKIHAFNPNQSFSITICLYIKFSTGS